MGSKTSPKVSVNMPCYNGSTYLAEAIQSVLEQSLTDFELLIINDGSTDDSVEIIESFDDPRIRLIHNERNLGIVATRNRGFAESRGEYIAILDCDDVALPNRLEKQVAFLDENPSFALLGSWMDVINEQGKTIEKFRPDIAPEAIVPRLVFMNWFAQSTVTLRRSMIPAEGYRAQYPFAEDYDLWVRIAAEPAVWNLPSVLVKYRWHAENTSSADLDAINRNALLVQIEQVKKLGLKPTEAEMATHWDVGAPQYREKSIETLLEAEAWLTKLVRANAKVGYFDRKLFAKTVADYWLSVCHVHSHLGPEAYDIGKHSILGWLTEDRLLTRTKLLAYYLLGRLPRGGVRGSSARGM